TRTPTRTPTPTPTATPVPARITWHSERTIERVPLSGSIVSVPFEVSAPVDGAALQLMARKGLVEVESTLPTRLQPGQRYMVRLRVAMTNYRVGQSETITLSLRSRDRALRDPVVLRLTRS